MRKLIGLLCSCGAAFVLLASSSVHADVLSAAPLHAGLRFRVENERLEVLSHWPNPVSAQFLSLTDPHIQQHALTQILQLSHAARVDLTIEGFPNAMFAETSEISSDARIVILEYDPRFESQLIAGITIEELGYTGTNSHIEWILETGLVASGPGCWGRWKASMPNELEGFVLAISSSAGLDDKKTCLSNYLPPAFGVSSIANLYDLSIMFDTGENRGAPVLLLDRSETLLSLMAGAACRDDLNDMTPACPFRVIENIWHHHFSVLNDIRN